MTIRAARRGFTLIELLLVLGVLCALAAFAWPSFEQSFELRRTESAAEQVRNLFRSARRQAIADSIPYRAEFAVGTNRCRIVPIQAPLDVSATAMEGSAVAASNSGPVDDLNAVAEESLPDGVIIGRIDQTSGSSNIRPETAPVRPPPTAAASNPNSPALTSASAELQWTEAAVFYPDGSSQDRAFVLADRRGRSIEIRVYGLNGVVEISPIVDPEAESADLKPNAETSGP